jgi:hypothetical protein
MSFATKRLFSGCDTEWEFCTTVHHDPEPVLKKINSGNGAEDGARTRHPQLGRLMLYQMSYFRLDQVGIFLWGEEDSNLRSLTTADLQSDPFGHSGISPT